jgi:hypothetical protein
MVPSPLSLPGRRDPGLDRRAATRVGRRRRPAGRRSPALWWWSAGLMRNVRGDLNADAPRSLMVPLPRCTLPLQDARQRRCCQRRRTHSTGLAQLPLVRGCGYPLTDIATERIFATAGNSTRGQIDVQQPSPRRWWSQHHERPDTPGRFTSVSGMVCSSPPTLKQWPPELPATLPVELPMTINASDRRRPSTSLADKPSASNCPLNSHRPHRSLGQRLPGYGGTPASSSA